MKAILTTGLCALSSLVATSALANTQIEREASIDGSGILLQLKSNGDNHSGRLGFGGFFNNDAFIGTLAMGIEAHLGPTGQSEQVINDDLSLGEDYEHYRFGFFIDMYQQQPEMGRDRAASGMGQVYAYNTRSGDLNNYGLGANIGFGLSLTGPLFLNLDLGLRPGILSTAVFSQGLGYLGEYDWGLGLHLAFSHRLTLIADYTGMGLLHSDNPGQFNQSASAGIRLMF